jgi:hypothetical protein
MIRLPLIGLLVGIMALAGCQDENFTESPSAKLNFSTDTVFFDTIFRTVSTATKRFKAFNPQDQRVKIDEVELMGGQASKFRVNVNGRATNSVEGLELRSRDSLFIFVELTIDQSKSGNHYLVRDSLRFVTNGNTQYVNLTAVGRQVIIHDREVLRNDQTWTADTPHLLIDFALVDSSTTLSIPAGTEVFGTGGSRLFVEGSLNVNGTAEEPVTFEGARPDPEFKGRPGQWQGIRLLPASEQNVIEHAIITEGNVGVQVDSFAADGQVKLRLRSSRISDMAGVGLAGFSTSILAQNTIVNDCCGNLVVGQDGGTYQFFHCTFMAGNCQCSPDGTPVIFENDPSVGRDSLTLSILNSIVYSFRENAYRLVATGEGGSINAAVRYSLVKIGDRAPDVVEAITDTTNIRNAVPLFKGICNNNFNLTEASPALDTGRSLPPTLIQLGLDSDYADNQRSVNNPDLGSLEFQP